jgi:AraC-like DNA-binding protein
VQLSFSGQPAVAFRSGDTEVWTEYAGCLIPADVPHAIDASYRPFANIFVDPETPEGRSLRRRIEAGGGGESIVRLDDAESRAAAAVLYGCWTETSDCGRLASAAREVVQRFVGTTPPRVLSDPRVLGAIELIRTRLDGRVTLPGIARELHVSPSRLRHLFVEEVGLPFRTFVLWERLRRVIQSFGTESLTRVALSAGFADSAHMTRTFRRMLGFAPSLLRQP